MSEFNLMTKEEAAKKLGVTPAWLSEKANAGIVPSRKIGRYRRYTDDDLQEYLERVKQGALDPFARSAQSRARRRRAS